jgi:uncharacterized protein (TIGR00369 family)
MPFAALLGIDLKEAGKERVVAELRVREELCTSNSILHGGAVMAFADSLGGLATFLNLPEGAKGTTTIESKTNFLGAARVGQIVTAECTPIHRGRTTQVWQTRLTGEGGRLVALVTQTQMVLI